MSGHCVWCEAPVRRPIIEAGRSGLTVNATATTTRMHRSAVARVLADARRKGCLPPANPAMPTRGASTIRIHGMCEYAPCGKPYVAKRAGTHYCSPEHGRLARASGARVNEKHTGFAEDERELGPEEPPIKPDVKGMWRRALEAAKDGVDGESMRARFPTKMAEQAIEEARRLGYRMPSHGRGLSSSLAWLPAGLPA